MSDARDDETLSFDERAVVRLLADDGGTDLTRFRASTTRRRIAHRARLCGLQSVADYARLLVDDAAERRQLADAVLIKTTSMFRDDATFAALRSRALPILAKHRARGGARVLRAWIAGCATGEEAYSLALCLAEACDGVQAGLAPYVLASDVSTSALERARQGLLSEQDVARVPPPLAAAYLRRDREGWRLAPEVCARVRFVVHDLLDPQRAVPPQAVFASFDLVSCRNLLIYLTDQAQACAGARLLAACERPGVLVVGKADPTPRSPTGTLEPFDEGGRVYLAHRPAPALPPQRA